MPKQDTDTRDQAQVNPQIEAARAMEIALTDEDYATNSEALQECIRAWARIREGASS